MFHFFAISDMGLSYCRSGGQTSSGPSRFQPVARPMRDKRDPAIADLAAQQTFQFCRCQRRRKDAPARRGKNASQAQPS